MLFRSEVKEGDVVLFGRFSNQRVEYSMHQTLFKEEGEYFVIQRKWMSAIAKGKMETAVEKGILA